MKQNQKERRKEQSEDMLKVKTNQDFNKQKPNPNDPNQNKNRQTVEPENADNKRGETYGKTLNPSNDSRTHDFRESDSPYLYNKSSRTSSGRNNKMFEEEIQENENTYNSSNKNYEDDRRKQRWESLREESKTEKQKSK